MKGLSRQIQLLLPKEKQFLHQIYTKTIQEYAYIWEEFEDIEKLRKILLFIVKLFYIEHKGLRDLSQFDQEKFKKSFRELTEDFAKKHGLYFARESSKHSELYLNQSPEEFYATVDSLIEDCGLNLETIQQMHEGTNTMTVLNDYAFPVYIKLREMGYTHMELTS